MELDWSGLLDKGATTFIAIYVIIRLEPRFVELRDAVRDFTRELKELKSLIQRLNGVGSP